uniref:Glycosyltransferase family 92 protein n=1 Tax=Timema poppense TaxID=170557 RepID=A0A7R9DDH3_TIMPO|nr:unnamed protein product [Timema poppensis]
MVAKRARKQMASLGQLVACASLADRYPSCRCSQLANWSPARRSLIAIPVVAAVKCTLSHLPQAFWLVASSAAGSPMRGNPNNQEAAEAREILFRKYQMGHPYYFSNKLWLFKAAQRRKCTHICVEREREREWKTLLEKPASVHPNLDLPVIGSLVYSESSALAHAATKQVKGILGADIFTCSSSHKFQIPFVFSPTGKLVLNVIMGAVGFQNVRRMLYVPYLIACQIPQNYNNLIPQSVSIVQKPCDPANNNIRVVYNKPEHKKEFAVCVKGLDFLHDDLSVRLVEWLELMIILGADKVFFYKLQVHPNISKVLNYYEKLGKVEVTPLSLPGGEPNLPGLQHISNVSTIIINDNDSNSLGARHTDTNHSTCTRRRINAKTTAGDRRKRRKRRGVVADRTSDGQLDLARLDDLSPHFLLLSYYGARCGRTARTTLGAPLVFR